MVAPNILVFQEGPFLTSLNGLEPITGKLLWRTPQRNIVSNFIAIGNTLFAITPDPAIVAYHAVTGHETGRVGFTGGALETTYGPEYWLLATKDEIFAYFSDSRELIAFDTK
jgi:hypothetical protein